MFCTEQVMSVGITTYTLDKNFLVLSFVCVCMYLHIFMWDSQGLGMLTLFILFTWMRGEKLQSWKKITKVKWKILDLITLKESCTVTLHRAFPLPQAGHSHMAAEQRYFSTLSFNSYANSLTCCSWGRRPEEKPERNGRKRLVGRGLLLKHGIDLTSFT